MPVDPRAAIDGPLDPDLEAIRRGLGPHRYRLWVRRLVRRGWIAVAAVAVAEAGLWTLARFVPLEAAPLIAATLPVVALLALLGAALLARPGLGETALALDAEGHLGDRVSSSLELAIAFPASARPLPEGTADEAIGPASALAVGDEEDLEVDRFVRRQRQDALAALRRAPALFRPRLSRPALGAIVVSALILVPVLALPNPQDAVIAQGRQEREAAERQAERLDQLADELDGTGQQTNDPRRQLAEQLRELARRLRERPEDLAANLRELGSVENDVRARIDPAAEQRAAAMTSLARSLSRAATANPDANRDGDPQQTREDLDRLAERLDSMTPQQQRDLARQLAAMEATAAGADGATATALQDAAQSLAQGDVAGARSALGRVGQSMTGAQARIEQSRDLSRVASRIQDARRELADASQTGQPGQAQGSPRPGTGQGQAGGSPQPSGQGQGQGQGAIGGGGSNARRLGSGVGGNGAARVPTGANRAAELGADLSSVFAPFDRLGKPGDPSYVAGTGGDGQTQGGGQTGSGIDNGTLTPYQRVFTDFQTYAQTSLDRGYVPLSIKDYVRDYFSSLDPSN